MTNNKAYRTWKIQAPWIEQLPPTALFTTKAKMDQQNPDFPYEEYGALKGLTNPGFSRSYNKNINPFPDSVESFLMSDVTEEARPSGVVLPKILREKLRNATVKAETGHDVNGPIEGEGSSDQPVYDRNKATLLERMTHYDTKCQESKSPIQQNQVGHREEEEMEEDLNAFLPSQYNPRKSYNIDPDTIFTTSDIERLLLRANVALVDIHKQLHRGEELYFQETDAHGNIFKGWDTLIDSKAEHLGIPMHEVGGENDGSATMRSQSAQSHGSNNNSSHHAGSSTPNKRMHADNRWFSSSSYISDNDPFRS